MKTKVQIFDKLPWDVCLFFALYVLAPAYCAIELSAKFPLITVSRVLIVLIGTMLVLRRRRDLFYLPTLDIRSLNFGLSTDRWLRWGLFVYFGLLTVCHMVLLPVNTGEEIKAIFVLWIESYALVWMLSLVLNTRRKIIAALRILVLASGVTAIIAAVGCIFGCNPFHALNFVSRDMVLNFEYRQGMLRASAGFQHACHYGAFCTIISPINMYLVEYSERRWEKKLFSLCLALNIVGIVLSNSRGSFVTFGFLVIVAAIWAIFHREFGKFLRTYVPVGVLATLLLVIVAVLSPVGLVFLEGIVRSVLHIVFPGVSTDVVLKEHNTILSNGLNGGDGSVIPYGLNEGGGYSRLRQLTGIQWTLTQKPWFGFGSNAHMAGLISYQYIKGVWQVSQTFDVGIVAVICSYGIVGFLGHIALFGSLLKASFSKICFRDPLMRFLGFTLVIYLVHLLTIASLHKMLWILISAIVCLSNIIRRESMES